MSEIANLVRQYGGRLVGDNEAEVLRRRSRRLSTIGIPSAQVNVLLSQATRTNGGFVVARVMDYGRDTEFSVAFLTREAVESFADGIAPGTPRTVIDAAAPADAPIYIALW